MSAPALQLLSLTINDLPRDWGQIEPLLNKACEFSGGEFTPQSVLAGMGLHDGVERLKMLALLDGDTITSIMVVCVSLAPSGKRALECLLTGGRDVRAWTPFEPQMDEWARALGCSRVRIPRGRKGWIDVLGARPDGSSVPSDWRIAGYVLEREI